MATSSSVSSGKEDAEKNGDQSPASAASFKATTPGIRKSAPQSHGTPISQPPKPAPKLRWSTIGASENRKSEAGQKGASTRISKKPAKF